MLELSPPSVKDRVKAEFAEPGESWLQNLLMEPGETPEQAIELLQPYYPNQELRLDVDHLVLDDGEVVNGYQYTDLTGLFNRPAIEAQLQSAAVYGKPIKSSLLKLD